MHELSQYNSYYSITDTFSCVIYVSVYQFEPDVEILWLIKWWNNTTSLSQLWNVAWYEIHVEYCVYFHCSGHVLTEDTASQNIVAGHLYTKRLLTKTNHLPRWGERFIPGPRQVCIIEESVVNPKTQTITTYTRNIGYTTIMVTTLCCLSLFSSVSYFISSYRYCCSTYCQRITPVKRW